MANHEHNFLIKLINAVKKYPQLYDYVKYPPGIREVQNECAKIWAILSKQLGEPKELCKKKWQVVRGSYQRYLKQIDIAKVPYYLSSHMEFLLPLYNSRFKPDTHQLENDLENSDEDDDDDDDNDDYIIEEDNDDNQPHDEDWLTDNVFKSENNNEDEIQPFESIEIKEEISSLNNTLNESKLPDTKYVTDMPFAIKLLNNIKKFPDLYVCDGKPVVDCTAIWEKISEDLGEIPEICRKKWRIFRGSYQRYLKKIDTSPTPYYLSEHMKFLLPFYGKYLPMSHKYLIKEYLDKHKDEYDELHKNSEYDEIQRTSEYDENCNDDNSLEEINFIDINKNKRRTTENFDNEEDSPDFKRIRVKSDLTSDIEDNGDLIFLKSLLPDLKLLDTNKKITFRISVLNLVKELLEK